MARISREMRQALSSMDPHKPDDPDFLGRIDEAHAHDKARKATAVPDHIQRARARNTVLEHTITDQIRAERAERNRALTRQVQLIRTQQDEQAREMNRQFRTRETTSARATEVAAAREPANEAWRRWVDGMIMHPERKFSLDIPDAIRLEWLTCHEAVKHPNRVKGFILDHGENNLSIIFTEQDSRQHAELTESDLYVYDALDTDPRDCVDELFYEGQLTERDSLLQYMQMSVRTRTLGVGRRERATLQIDDYVCNDDLAHTATDNVLLKMRRFKELGFTWIFLPLHVDLPGAYRIDSGHYNITEKDREDLGISTDPRFDEFKVMKLD